MIALTVIVVLLALFGILWGVGMMYAVAMTDGESPKGWEFWKLFWPTYASWGLGVLMILWRLL